MAERAQCGHQSLVHFAGQYHERNVAGLCVSDAQAGDKLALLAQRLEHAGQLHTAAVHHGYLVTVTHQLCNGPGAAVEKSLDFKARTAQFDHVLHCGPSAANFIPDLPTRASRASH